MTIIVKTGVALAQGPRSRMEDATAVARHPALGGRRLAVFDGLGGMGDGAAAARAAAAVFEASADALPDVVWRMHRAVLAAQTRCKCMTTVAAVEFAAETSPTWSATQGLVGRAQQPPVAVELHVIWSGDSRVYTFVRGTLARATEDHGLGALVSKCLGSDRWPPQQAKARVRPGDLVLLCTDGLHDTLADDDIADILRRRDGVTLDALAQQLVSAALLGGASDNVTAMLAEVAS